MTNRVYYWPSPAEQAWAVQIIKDNTPSQTYGLSWAIVGEDREDILVKFLRNNPAYSGYEIGPLPVS